jgi:hypothetical protein
MKILIKPSEIVQMNMFDTFSSRVCKNQEEAKQLLIEDKEFELGLNDALVMDFITCIPTDNLIYRFNLELLEFLGNRSTLQKFPTKTTNNEEVMMDYGVVRVNGLNKIIEDYIPTKYPSYWKPPINYKVRLDMLTEHIENIKEELLKKNKYTIVSMNKKFEVFKVDEIKKLFDFKPY